MKYSDLKEHVDFHEKIGEWIDKSGNGLDKSTNTGIVHYSKNGAHIIPSNPHSNDKFINIGYIRSSIQVALLGHITTNLRALYIEYKDIHITLNFIYYENPNEDELELANLVHSEFYADFPFSKFSIDFEVLIIPISKQIPKRGFFVYLRFEG